MGRHARARPRLAGARRLALQAIVAATPEEPAGEAAVQALGDLGDPRAEPTLLSLL